MWAKKDEFLKMPTNAPFKAPQPGNIGGANLGKNLGAAPDPYVCEVEAGTEATEKARTEYAKAGDATNPVADMPDIPEVSTFRESGVESLERAFDLPKNSDLK